MELSLNPISYNSFTTFGDLLKYLRRRERLTQLELSIAVGYSESQITRLEKNQRLPDLTAIQALFIPALHLEDEPQLTARFLELAQTARQEDAPAPGIAPYKGLLFFDESDFEMFFGREALTTKLAKHVMDLAMDAPTRFLAVLGASGSGKSSLVRAGLVVALKRAGWEACVFTPSDNPLKLLGVNLKSAGVKNAERVLILVDQFEEVFTLCHDEMERIAFIEKLLSSAQDKSKKTTVVIALRADFYSHCAQYPLLRLAVAAEQEYIGQMTFEELRRAIEVPARRGGWEFEPGLVDVLLNDIGAQGASEPEPGALPLLSHALLATWERRVGRRFTLSGYHASGGVRGAIAETAESVFNDQLDHTQRELARDVFLRLTELGEGTEDTRRRAALNELVRQSAEATQVRAVLNTLAEARLITLNEDSAEVAHEALIREWKRLHEWLSQDRQGLLLHRHLTDAAHEWERRGNEPSELYRGARLAQAREWASVHGGRLNPSEQAFLAASIEHEEHEAMEREAQRQRELEAAQKLAETEKHRAEEKDRAAVQLRRRQFYLLGVLVLAVIAALSAGFFANRSAINLTRSEAQRLAAEANSLMLNNGDPNLIALLSIRSLTMQYTPSGDAMLSNLTALQSPPRELKGHTGNILGVDISPDGKFLATGSEDSTARLWDLASGQPVHTFSGHTNGVFGVAFSPDGKYLVSASGDSTVRLWEVATGKTLKVFSAPTGLEYVVFSPDGRFIATVGHDPDARIWDVATGKIVNILTGHENILTRLAYSPNGKYLLTGSLDTTARLWDAATGDQVQVFPGHNPAVGSVAFSPDGRYVATGDEPMVRLWDPATGQMVREFNGHQGWVSGIEFSPGGKTMATVSHDKTARLWDLATGQSIRVIGRHAAAVQDLAFSPDSRLIVTAGDDRIAKAWSLQTFPGGLQFAGHGGFVRQASFSPDGKQVVTANEDGTARIWEAVTGQLLTTLSGHTLAVIGAVFSPDGKLVLTTSEDTTARLWDAARGEELRRFEGHTDLVNRAIFSADGKYVVTTSFDGTARVWDAQTAETILTYTNQGPGHVNRIALSPDGKIVATGGDDGTVRIWDPLTGEDLMIFEGYTSNVTGLAFSPDGKYLVASSWDGTVRLWDTANGREVRRFAGHTGKVSGADFSPDGKTVLSSGEDGTVRLWDVQTGQEIRRFTGHTNWVLNVVFSLDGKYILTASEDNTARLWLTDLQDTIDAVCTLLTRDLTPEERAQFDISDQEPTCPNP